jgi:NADH:ubiquinone oxidoreductase subunit 5 (subunit L)/multisubunit Na+/H+ antiporter MnhA subunit
MKVTETLERTAAFLADRVKLGLLDTVAKGLTRMAQSSSRGLCKLQSGYVRQYALAILLGVAAIMAWFIFT